MEEEMATHSSILAWDSPMDRGGWWVTVHGGHKGLGTTEHTRRFLKQLEIELPYDPAIPLLGIHTEETRRERDTCALPLATRMET